MLVLPLYVFFINSIYYIARYGIFTFFALQFFSLSISKWIGLLENCVSVWYTSQCYVYILPSAKKNFIILLHDNLFFSYFNLITIQIAIEIKCIALCIVSYLFYRDVDSFKLWAFEKCENDYKLFGTATSRKGNKKFSTRYSYMLIIKCCKKKIVFFFGFVVVLEQTQMFPQHISCAIKRRLRIKHLSAVRRP